MGKIEIQRDKCKGCGLCIESCAQKLIRQDTSLNKRGIHPVYYVGEGCSACRLCALVCPDCCIEVYK